MSGGGARWRGVVNVLTADHRTARALAVADSRVLVRALFLGSAVRVGLFDLLEVPRDLDVIAAGMGATRRDRLTAWLAVGVELGELRASAGRYAIRGRRSRALAAGDPVLLAHYRSVLDYQTGPYANLSSLLQAAPGEGRDDLDTYATVIADVSRAAEPFVAPYLQRAVRRLRPRSVLDAGCGSGVYIEAMLDADPAVVVDGVDVASDVVDAARSRLATRGLTARASITAADLHQWQPDPNTTYGLVTLLNNVYYFSPDERIALYRRLGGFLAPGGELLVTTMTTPGSLASTHLHLMLVSQSGVAGLPSRDALVQEVRAAGFTVVETDSLVPAEPFVAIRARRVGSSRSPNA
jgi:4-hydroxy-2,2'-bipyrrole-5-carbaldehyde O-methyltransferase